MVSVIAKTLSEKLYIHFYIDICIYKDMHRGSLHVETNPREGEKNRLIGD